jgi:hypothetical protein
MSEHSYFRSPDPVDFNICVYKNSQNNKGTTFNGNKLHPDSDLNRCISCDGFDTECSGYKSFRTMREKGVGFVVNIKPRLDGIS